MAIPSVFKAFSRSSSSSSWARNSKSANWISLKSSIISTPVSYTHLEQVGNHCYGRLCYDFTKIIIKENIDALDTRVFHVFFDHKTALLKSVQYLMMSNKITYDNILLDKLKNLQELDVYKRQRRGAPKKCRTPGRFPKILSTQPAYQPAYWRCGNNAPRGNV